MNDIRLLHPTMEYEAALLQFCEEIRNAHDADAFAGCGNLRRTTNIQEWLDDLALREHAETCPANRVPSTTFLAVCGCDHKVVGIITLRYPGNDLSAIRTGGHIGYSVRPSERRKGYATEMLRLILEECQRRKMSRILLTCYRDNIASERTILAGGGVFEDELEDDGEILKRYRITLPLNDLAYSNSRL